MSQTEQNEQAIDTDFPDPQIVAKPEKPELTDADHSAKTNAIICYALFLASFITGITFIIGGIWGYLKRGEAKGTAFEDHFSNIITTFWVAILLTFIGALTLLIGIGYIVLLIGAIYTLWKSIKGLSRITSNKAYKA